MNSKKILVILGILVLSSYLVSCTVTGIKDNKVYEVKETSKSKDIKKISESINTEGIDIFKDIANLVNNTVITPEDILITISDDGKLSYAMTQIKEAKNSPMTIKGETIRKVNLIKIDNKTKERKIIATEIPFVSIVKWNNDKTVVAFCGGGRLTIYDTKLNKSVISDELKNEQIIYFGFSPDGRKIYTEHPNLINSSIISIDINKIVHSYEQTDCMYYKGTLDSNYYYVSKTNTNGTLPTTIIDKQEVVKKELSIGRFRDSYKKAILQTGKERFGLFYIKDINEDEDFKMITDEFVLDVKFIGDGKFIYTTENKDEEKNSFYLHLVNDKGIEEKKIEISSGVVSLLPNGEKIYVGGYKEEVINLKSFIVEASINPEFGEEENVFKTLRGAMYILYKYEVNSVKDFEGVKKYFIDTKNPDQWAYFDVTTTLNESPNFSLSGVNLKITLHLENLKLYDNDTKATAKVSVLAENSAGSGTAMDNSVELIKKEDRWYITGFSTFPQGEEYKIVKTKVESLISLIKSGNLKQENNIIKELKGKAMEIGQIQFWRMSEPHLAADVEYSNHCKIYIKVRENNKELIYKMRLSKDNENKWIFDAIAKDRLSFLY